MLYYLLQHRKTTLADWLLSKGARANCILRWQFVVEDRVMKPMEILRLMEWTQISLLLKSDDGLLPIVEAVQAGHRDIVAQLLPLTRELAGATVDEVMERCKPKPVEKK